MRKMKEQITLPNNKLRLIIFILSLIVLAYWVIGNSVNVYRFAITGAAFEMLSLQCWSYYF
jgi:hypothetical protein